MRVTIYNYGHSPPRGTLGDGVLISFAGFVLYRNACNHLSIICGCVILQLLHLRHHHPLVLVFVDMEQESYSKGSYDRVRETPAIMLPTVY